MKNNTLARSDELDSKSEIVEFKPSVSRKQDPGRRLWGVTQDIEAGSTGITQRVRNLWSQEDFGNENRSLAKRLWPSDEYREENQREGSQIERRLWRPYNETLGV